jgi:hypothetical protein
MKEIKIRKRYAVSVTHKECFCCKINKIAKDFPKNSQLKGGLHTYCKECSNRKNKENEYYKTSASERKRKMKTDPIYNKHVRENKNLNRKKNIATSLLNSCKIRALKNNLEFNLIKEDIIIPKICPILKVPLICGNKNDYSHSPSVDRIDNTKGYTKDNIQIISMKANTMKNNGTIKELKLLAKWINKQFT